MVFKMGKIIITIDGNIPSKLAHSFNVMKMAQGFNQAGLEVEVVSLLSLPNIIDLLKIRNIHKHYGISKKIKIKLIPVWNKDFFNKKTGAKNFNQKAVKYFLKKKPDFVYCRSYLSVIECIKNRIPCFIETHTTLYSHHDLNKVFELAKSKYLIGLITINEILANEYNKRGVPRKKIIVEEDGVDLQLFNINDDKAHWRQKLNLPMGKNIVMYVGSLYKEKGIEQIIKIKKILNDDKSIIFYLIGGTNNQILEWQKYCREIDAKNIFFLGFKSNTDLPKYYKASDILIMPYDTKINYGVMDINTTSPLKLFEYLATKRPIVSTKIPIMEKIVVNNESAILVEPNIISDYAEAIKELINNSKLNIKISKKSSSLAQKYSWENRCQKIINYFKENYVQ